MQKTFHVMETAVVVSASQISRPYYKYEKLPCKNKKKESSILAYFPLNFMINDKIVSLYSTSNIKNCVSSLLSKLLSATNIILLCPFGNIGPKVIPSTLST